jgi:fatty acyl-CoA reductase
MILAIFDVDHTLLKADSLKLFGLFLWKKKGIRLSHLPGFVVSLFAWCLALTDTGKLKAGYLKLLCGGMPISAATELGREFAESLLGSKVFPQALELIHRHKTERHEIVLLSASPDIYLERLAELLGADMLICTKLSRATDFLTGDLEGGNCKGREKLRRLLEQYREHNIDWSRSFAYSDSLSDLPILERAGRPVAVNPDRRLARIAVRRRWRIERWDT